jgi:hypothetical protein
MRLYKLAPKIPKRRNRITLKPVRSFERVPANKAAR